MSLVLEKRYCIRQYVSDPLNTYKFVTDPVSKSLAFVDMHLEFDTIHEAEEHLFEWLQNKINLAGEDNILPLGEYFICRVYRVTRQSPKDKKNVCHIFKEGK